MLERFVLPIDYGVSYGSVTLKSLQNDNVPELDLLVRELSKTVQMRRYKKLIRSLLLILQLAPFAPLNLTFI